MRSPFVIFNVLLLTFWDLILIIWNPSVGWLSESWWPRVLILPLVFLLLTHLVVLLVAIGSLKPVGDQPPADALCRQKAKKLLRGLPKIEKWVVAFVVLAWSATWSFYQIRLRAIASQLTHQEQSTLLCNYVVSAYDNVSNNYKTKQLVIMAEASPYLAVPDSMKDDVVVKVQESLIARGLFHKVRSNPAGGPRL